MKFTTLISLLFVFGSWQGIAQDDIHVPNIITPNDDNVNDIFFIRAVNYSSVSCTIVNRYGETIYRYFGSNGNWDGYTHAGVKVSAGTYFVIVEATDPNGSIVTRQSSLQVQY